MSPWALQVKMDQNTFRHCESQDANAAGPVQGAVGQENDERFVDRSSTFGAECASGQMHDLAAAWRMLAAKGLIRRRNDEAADRAAGYAFRGGDNAGLRSAVGQRHCARL